MSVHPPPAETPDSLPERSLRSVGVQRRLALGGLELRGRRRRPSGERPPLPRQLHAGGQAWLIAGVLAVLLWVSLFMWPSTANWWEARDHTLLQWFVARRTDLLTEIAEALHALGSPWLWRMIRWGVLLYLAVSRRWRHLLVVVLVFFLLETAVDVLAVAIGRPRPFVPILGGWHGYAHPSAPVASLAVTVAVAGMVLLPSGRWRRLWMLTGAVTVALLGLARVYLGVDHATDVVVSATFAPALAVLAVWWLVPESVFPVAFRHGAAAHLDVSGRRGQAIKAALRDQLGLEATEIEPFGLEASGGSTPLRIRVADGPDEYVFAKLYSTTHVRADRWYKVARTILYGSLEDEARFLSVRALVEREDYLLRVMSDAGIPSPDPYGVVEITPEREYLVVTEFFRDAEEITVADIDDDLIDQGLQLVQRLWHAGLAHRDIKPANVLIQDGEIRLVDVSFGMILPSPWRQAIDLANMMIILALRTDPERVYERALKYFAEDDIAEAFAATRSVTIPSQSRSSLRLLAKRQGIDIIARFRELAPPREPIAIQRWSRRRIVLTLGALLMAFVFVGLAIENIRGEGFM